MQVEHISEPLRFSSVSLRADNKYHWRANICQKEKKKKKKPD